MPRAPEVYVRVGQFGGPAFQGAKVATGRFDFRARELGSAAGYAARAATANGSVTRVACAPEHQLMRQCCLPRKAASTHRDARRANR